MKTFLLKDQIGQVIRVFRCEAKNICLVYRKNKGRLDLCSSPNFFEKESVVLISEWEVDKMESIQKIPLIQGVLEMCDRVLNVSYFSLRVVSHSKNFWKVYTFVGGIYMLLIGSLYGLSQMKSSDKVQMLEPQIVQIIKPPTVVQPEKVMIGSKEVFIRKADKPVKKKILKKSLKKMGALSALGSLSKTRNFKNAGLDMGASKVSTGPGLRALSSSSASGGVQSSIYNKGMITSALGSGGNIRGGGGHGTKGQQAGGGQAGYGELTLIGSGGSEDLSTTTTLSQQGGSFDFGLIDREIIKRIGKVRECYDMSLRSEPHLKGLFKIHFIINSKGQVILSRVHAVSPIRSSKISSCILSVINKIQFPIQLTSAVGINYTFDLNTLETEGG